mmetsp:Transcript_16171/g.34185  ORF Transcript_16171/g.34185 Transcript_16171/m.34185 type:complete len:81 (-) Transcript_16171:1644-1886(-)
MSLKRINSGIDPKRNHNIILMKGIFDLNSNYWGGRFNTTLIQALLPILLLNPGSNDKESWIPITVHLYSRSVDKVVSTEC